MGQIDKTNPEFILASHVGDILLQTDKLLQTDDELTREAARAKITQIIEAARTEGTLPQICEKLAANAETTAQKIYSLTKQDISLTTTDTRENLNYAAATRLVIQAQFHPPAPES